MLLAELYSVIALRLYQTHFFLFDGVNESEQGFQHIPVEKLGSDVQFHSKSLKVQ